jgi:hypothetical protein
MLLHRPGLILPTSISAQPQSEEPLNLLPPLSHLLLHLLPLFLCRQVEIDLRLLQFLVFHPSLRRIRLVVGRSLVADLLREGRRRGAAVDEFGDVFVI